MNTMLKSFALALALVGAPLAAEATPVWQHVDAKAAGHAKLDRKKITEHLRQHQTYPATKAELVKACNSLMDFTGEERKWFGDTLPERSYASADEVLKVLFKK